MKKVPLVLYKENGERVVLGEATVEDDLTIHGVISEEIDLEEALQMGYTFQASVKM